jgi:transcription elongation factor Elf1
VWMFHCTACGAEQVSSFCFMCEQPVAATPEVQLLTCGTCGALRRRFSCASRGKATAVWAPEDRDVWTFNCSACGAAQRITIPQGDDGVDVRRPASASGGRSRS